MIKRFGTPPKAGIRYKIRPGAYVILLRNGRVLLTFPESPFSEFQIPGGGIDPGEHMIPALRREVMEETGWTIGAPVRLGSFRRFAYMKEYDFWAEKICHIYFARPALKFSDPTEEGHQCRWVSPAQAINLVANPGDRHFLKVALRHLL